MSPSGYNAGEGTGQSPLCLNLFGLPSLWGKAKSSIPPLPHYLWKDSDSQAAESSALSSLPAHQKTKKKGKKGKKPHIKMKTMKWGLIFKSVLVCRSLTCTESSQVSGALVWGVTSSWNNGGISARCIGMNILQSCVPGPPETSPKPEQNEWEAETISSQDCHGL